ncbi:hypothetical protein D3C85_378260 [compost metagenome]
MQNWFKTDFIYDLEIFPNIFTFCAVYANGKGIRVFEISDRKDDTVGMMEFLRKVKAGGFRLVGFNNKNFDYVILHYIIEKSRKCIAKEKALKFTPKELYDVGMEVINSMKDERFGKSIKDNDIVIPQVDLYLVNHFDNRARSTSLKMLEFNMRSNNIEDLPFPVGKVLDNSEKDVLIKYNKHDVSETLKFYHYCYNALKLREDLTKQFGFDCTNFNDTKIGKELFIRRLEDVKPGCCYTKGKFGRTVNQTKRDKIVIKDCLFSYIEFDRPEFKAVHEWFKKQIITETKGVFSDLLEHSLGDVAKYAQMVVKKKKLSDPVDSKNKRYVPSEERITDLRKEQPLGWVEEKDLKSPKGAKSYYWCYNVAETLNVVIDGFRYDYGVGGIHGAKQGTIHSTEKRKIRTLDVASYYPNMAIANRIYPQHLGETFCDVYKDLYVERKSYPKTHAANAALKLALNGVYGDSNNEFSPLYDPAYTMSITIGGQLSLCILMEKLIDHCGAEIIMCNTDGFEYIIDVDKFDEADKWVKWWEEVTGLEMEGDTYKTMHIRDVNNYISITEKDKVKTKGAYEVLPYEQLGWHKNHSAMVIPMAVNAHLIDGIDYEEFIRLHENKFDFLLRTKVPRSSKLVLVVDDQDIEQQNICRYYPCKSGGKLVKIMPPLQEGGEWRRLGIDTEWSVKTCNNVLDFTTDIDYNYYLQEAKKLIDAVS